MKAVRAFSGAVGSAAALLNSYCLDRQPVVGQLSHLSWIGLLGADEGQGCMLHSKQQPQSCNNDIREVTCL